MTKIVLNITWDTKVDGEYAMPESLGLPDEISVTLGLSKELCHIIIDTMDVDLVIDKLSEQYGYHINSFIIFVEEVV